MNVLAALNTDPAMPSEADLPGETFYMYAVADWPYSLESLDELPIHDIKESLRGLSRAEFLASSRAVLKAAGAAIQERIDHLEGKLSPEVRLQLPVVRKSVREKQPVSLPHGTDLQALAELLYWSMSKDLYEKDGVPRSWIYRSLGVTAQALPNAARVLESATVACPCCGATAILAGAMFGGNGMAAGSVQCTGCGHCEEVGFNDIGEFWSKSTGKSAPNAMGCTCRSCSPKREEALAAIAELATGLADKVYAAVEAATMRWAGAGEPFDGDRRKMDRTSIDSYCKFRREGRTPLHAALSTWGGVENSVLSHSSMSPDWLAYLAANGFFEKGECQMLQGELSRKFVDGQLSRDADGYPGWRVIEQELRSQDLGRTFGALCALAKAMSDWRQTRILPMRWPVRERTSAVLRHPIPPFFKPRHINSGYPRALATVKMDRLLSGDHGWPLPEGAPLLADEEQRAIELLTARGYTVTAATAL